MDVEGRKLEWWACFPEEVATLHRCRVLFSPESRNDGREWRGGAWAEITKRGNRAAPAVAAFQTQFTGINIGTRSAAIGPIKAYWNRRKTNDCWPPSTSPSFWVQRNSRLNSFVPILSKKTTDLQICIKYATQKAPLKLITTKLNNQLALIHNNPLQKRFSCR